MAGAAHPRLRGGDALQCRNGALGAKLIADLGGHQQPDHHEDGDGIAEPAPQPVEDPYHQQQQDHRLPDFFGSDCPETHRARRKQPVGAEACKAGVGCLGGEATPIGRVHRRFLQCCISARCAQEEIQAVESDLAFIALIYQVH